MALRVYLLIYAGGRAGGRDGQREHGEKWRGSRLGWLVAIEVFCSFRREAARLAGGKVRIS